MLAHLTDASIRSVLLALPVAIVLWIARRHLTSAFATRGLTTVVCGILLALFAFGQALPRPTHLRVLDIPPAAVSASIGKRAMPPTLLQETPQAAPLMAPVPQKPSPSDRLERGGGLCIRRHRICIPGPVFDGDVPYAKTARNLCSHFMHRCGSAVRIAPHHSTRDYGMAAPAHPASARLAGLDKRQTRCGSRSRRCARPPARRADRGAGAREPLHLLVPSTGVDAGGQTRVAG